MAKRAAQENDAVLFAAVLDWVRGWAGELGVVCVLTLLDEARFAYAEARQQRGDVYLPPWAIDAAADTRWTASVGWNRHPSLNLSRTAREIKEQIAEMQFAPTDAAWVNAPDPEHKEFTERADRKIKETEALNRRWQPYAHQRTPAPVGRPQFGIADTVSRLRQLFPTQDASVPLWEYVAVLVRTALPELGPDFGGSRAKALTRKSLQRR